MAGLAVWPRASRRSWAAAPVRAGASAGLHRRYRRDKPLLLQSPDERIEGTPAQPADRANRRLDDRVQQVAVGEVQFDGVEADAQRALGGVGERRGDFRHIVFVHGARGARLDSRNIGMDEVIALEQEPRAVRLGASVGKAIAEIQARPVLAAFAVALERGDRDMRDIFGNRHHLNGAFPEQRGHT